MNSDDDATGVFSVVNAAPGVIEVTAGQPAILRASGVSNIQNAGAIDGDIDLDGASTVANTGAISGEVNFGAGADVVKNSGGISALGVSAIFVAGDGLTLQNGGKISATSADAISLKGTSAGVASIHNSAGGVISASAGFDAIFDTAGVTKLHNAGEIDGDVNLAGGSLVVSTGAISGAVNFAGGTDLVQNWGDLHALAGSAISAASDTVTLQNWGRISAAHDDVIALTGANSVLNGVGGVIAAAAGFNAVKNTSGATTLDNRGEIAGNLDLGYGSRLTNAGALVGDTVFEAGKTLVRNSGHITSDDLQPALHFLSSAGADDVVINGATGVIDAAGKFAIFQEAGGSLQLYNYGQILGGVALSGAASLINAGTIEGLVAFGAGGAVAVNRGQIDGPITFSGVGNVYRGQAGAVTGSIVGAGADGVYFGGAGAETFDMTANGAKYVSGGAGDDTFLFTAAGLTAKTVVDGGSGNDTLTLTTGGVINASAFNHVVGVETLNLTGANTLTLANGFVSAANNGALTVRGGLGVDTISAAGVTTATDTVTIYGGAAGDVLAAGPCKMVFGYNTVSESTGPTYDKIVGVNFALDTFDVSAPAGAILAVNAPVATGALNAASFNVNLAADLGAAQLGAHDAVLFTASSGDQINQTFLVIDANGVAGYQANADLVIKVTGAIGTLAASNFV